MKIQLQGQGMRLRISEAELARLQAGETVENLTRLPGGAACRHALRKVAGAQAALQAEAGGWTFLLPADPLQAYVARLPCRDGLRFRLAVADDDAIEIDFEVDVRDSVRSRGAPRR